jgi:hypothetical protein
VALAKGLVSQDLDFKKEDGEFPPPSKSLSTKYTKRMPRPVSTVLKVWPMDPPRVPSSFPNHILV